MMAKELVVEFYQWDVHRNKDAMQLFLHDEIAFHWHSHKGFLKLNKSDLIDLAGEMERSYMSLRFDFSHIYKKVIPF